MKIQKIWNAINVLLSSSTTWIIKIPIEWIAFGFLSIKINARLLLCTGFSFSLCAMHCLTHLWSVTKFIIDFFLSNTADKMILWWSRLFEFLFLYCYYKLRFFSPPFCRPLHTPRLLLGFSFAFLSSFFHTCLSY